MKLVLKKATCSLLMLMLLLHISIIANVCLAEPFTIASNISIIDDNAFEGCLGINELILEEGVFKIGDNAFCNCNNLRIIRLPSSLESIGTGAFDDCGEILYFVCPKGSISSAWARSNSYDWNSDTVCRALIIGNNYTGTDMVLLGPTNDMHAVAFCLRQLHTTKYTVSEKANLTADGILSAIKTAFSSATEDDISFFYFSGHGDVDGSILGSDLSYLSPSMLRNCLDSIPGRKIIIVDTCYSGALLDVIESDMLENSNLKLRTSAVNSSDFASSFVRAFTVMTRSSTSNGNYYIMASCQSTEKAEEAYISSGNSGRYMGYFTYALCTGCGWDGVQNRSSYQAGDTNNDEIVSFNEAFVYAYDWALSMNPKQHAVASPSNCTYFSPFRY